jgi:hypothetical protein
MTGTIDPQLGPKVTEHPPNYVYFVRGVLGGIVFLLGGGAVLLIVLQVIPFQIIDDFWEAVSAYVLAGIFLASGLFFVVDAVRTTGPRVVVYERGLIAGREVFLWDQTETFHQLAAELNVSGVPVSLSEYSLRQKDGRVLRFTRGVCRAEALASEIQERINPRLLAEARAAFSAGQEVSFGDAAIDATGLKFSDVRNGKTRRLSWKEIRAIEADGMQIRVRTFDESRLAQFTASGPGIATRQVANLGAFLTLAAEILDRQAPTTSK